MTFIWPSARYFRKIVQYFVGLLLRNVFLASFDRFCFYHEEMDEFMDKESCLFFLLWWLVGADSFTHSVVKPRERETQREGKEKKLSREQKLGERATGRLEGLWPRQCLPRSSCCSFYYVLHARRSEKRIFSSLFFFVIFSIVFSCSRPSPFSRLSCHRARCCCCFSACSPFRNDVTRGSTRCGVLFPRGKPQVALETRAFRLSIIHVTRNLSPFLSPRCNYIFFFPSSFPFACLFFSHQAIIYNVTEWLIPRYHLSHDALR